MYPAGAVRVTEPPLQNVAGPDAVTVEGGVMMGRLMVLLLLQPEELVTVATSCSVLAAGLGSKITRLVPCPEVIVAFVADHEYVQSALLST